MQQCSRMKSHVMSNTIVQDIHRWHTMGHSVHIQLCFQHRTEDVHPDINKCSSGGQRTCFLKGCMREKALMRSSTMLPKGLDLLPVTVYEWGQQSLKPSSTAHANIAVQQCPVMPTAADVCLPPHYHVDWEEEGNRSIDRNLSLDK